MRLPIPVVAAVLAAGCAGGGAGAGATAGATATAGSARPTAAAAPQNQQPAPHPATDGNPGPIAGSFRVTCAENDGEIIDFTVDGNKAIGRVADPGAAKRYGFQKGEDVFRLTSDKLGYWTGEVRFRSVSGAQHWDAIQFVATDAGLNATFTNEPCYRTLPRVR